MKHILFLNPSWGVDYLLKRRLEKEEIPFEFVSLKDDPELYKKHGVTLTPVILTFDKTEVVDKIASVDEIIEFLKNVSNVEIIHSND